MSRMMKAPIAHSVRIPAGRQTLDGDVTIPVGAHGIVIFAHGSGSSRKSSRNRYVARVLNEAGLATLLMDLLTAAEEAIDLQTAQLRFDIPMLAERVSQATDFVLQDAETRGLRIGYFGASTGAGAALIAAARRPDEVQAVVSRGGRPDLAREHLSNVKAPTLLIVGENDEPVIGMNEEARRRMQAEVKLEIVPGATHLFEEPGTLEEVATYARDWLAGHLSAAPSTR
jgi:putative phosphoribosyl transferase